MDKPTSYQSSLPVLCIGNFTAGGAGKTPTALALATILKVMGRTPSFLLRGYGGTAKDAHLVAAEDISKLVGDEALLYRTHGPTVVSADRPAGAKLLEVTNSDIIVMDDGFQNPSLSKTASLIVVDASTGWGNGRVLPAGPLRAPLRRQLVQTDAILVMGDGPWVGDAVALAEQHNIPFFHGAIVPVQALDKDPVAVAFAGIGRPEKFFATIAKQVEMTHTLSYPDHHAYTDSDALKVLALADQGSGRILTTEKDYVRLLGAPRKSARSALAERVEVVKIKVQLSDEADVVSWLEAVLSS